MLKLKISLSTNLFFLGVVEVKKKININSPSHVELFDIKIDYFDSQNLYQLLSLSRHLMTFSFLHPKND
jgi:hypothetical protein